MASGSATPAQGLSRWLARCCVSALPALAALLAGGEAAQAVDPALLDAARKEGRVVWLTSQIMGEIALPLASAFKGAYGIDVAVSRVAPRQVADRLVQAARTRATGVDVIDGRSALPHLKRAGLLAPVDRIDALGLPRELVDSEGYWVATNLFFNGVAVNTDIVPPERRPRSLDDLLRPEWSGRMVWSNQATLSSGAGFVGALIKDRGEVGARAYLGQFARQHIASFDASSRQIVDKVIAGQLEVALQVFHHQAAISAGRGAPVAWMPVEPLSGSFTAAAITRQAPHPKAARLFVEFLVSRQGQEIFRDADALPARPGVGAKEAGLMPETGRFRAIYFTPEEIEAELPRWQNLRAELFP